MKNDGLILSKFAKSLSIHHYKFNKQWYLT
jgi:hypothetical protein